MSTFGVDGLALELVAKISAAPSSSRSFQVDIWLGWTSNCSASCTSVRSPLIAAIATFALKADVWFRRGLLLMLSPDSRANLARCQAEAPLIALCRFPKPALMSADRNPHARNQPRRREPMQTISVLL